MSTYSTVLQARKMLVNLDSWLEKATEFAATKKFDADTLLTARLAPDQFPLLRQVQAACDAGKFLAARAAGKDAPAHPDTETTIAGLRARIQSVIGFLDTLTEADFAGVATRQVRLHFLPGKYILAEDYLDEMAIPNFYFHLTTAYSILRHNGVELGKSNYIGGMKLHEG